MSTRRETFRTGLEKRTNLLFLRLVALTGLDALLSGLGLGDSMLNSHVPSVTLGGVLSLESMLRAGDLERESVSTILVEVGGMSEAEGTSGVLLLVGVLNEVEKTLSGLAGPRSNGVSNLGLLTTEVLPQVGGGNGLLAEPEVLLGETECAADLLTFAETQSSCQNTHFLRPGAL
jgi:hypothetical protein